MQVILTVDLYEPLTVLALCLALVACVWLVVRRNR